MCVVSYNEKIGRKLQKVKMVEGSNRVKISPSSEEEKLDMWVVS
jgi:hypothetical protein